jgi:hypothetical protein
VCVRIPEGAGPDHSEWIMNAQREELLRLVEKLPETEVPAMLDNVRHHLREAKTNPGLGLGSAPVRTVPPTLPGRGTCSTTGSATRHDRLVPLDP